MNFKKICLLFSLIICMVSLSSAQTDAEESKRQEEELKQALKSKRNVAENLDIRFFVPVKPDSWAISLTSSGGIMGGTRLLVALNSNGNVMCSAEETTYQNRFAEPEDFEAIARLVTSEIEYLTFDGLLQPAPQIAYCSDCSFQTLTINYRGDKKILTDNFAVGAFTGKRNQIKTIYQRLNDLNVCR